MPANQPIPTAIIIATNASKIFPNKPDDGLAVELGKGFATTGEVGGLTGGTAGGGATAKVASVLLGSGGGGGGGGGGWVGG